MAQHELLTVYDTKAEDPVYLPRWRWSCSCNAISAIWFTTKDRAEADHLLHVDTEPHQANYRPAGRST